MNAVHFLAPAEEEMKASAQYYEQQLPGLGHRFLDEVDRGVVACGKSSYQHTSIET